MPPLPRLPTMAEGVPRLVIFGDSHYACLKQAQIRRLVDLSSVEAEYWGHVGGRFRYLEFRDGAIHPTDDFTAHRFAKFNEKGRLFLPAADFDVILVAGARTYLARSFLGLLRCHAHGPFVSRGLQRRILTDHLHGQTGFRLGRCLAATGGPQVLLSPIAFYTESDAGRAEMTPDMAQIAPDIVPQLWEEVARITEDAGMTLIPQPPDSISDWLWTKVDHAVPDHLAKQDFEHHNASYGALVLAAALARIRAMPGPFGQLALRGPAAAGNMPLI